MIKQTTQQRPVGAIAPRPPVAADAAVALMAVAAAVLVWACARISDLHLVVKSGSGTTVVTVGAVIVTTLVVAAAGVGLLRLLERRTAKALRLWTMVAVTVWALSFLGPLSATRPSTGLVLALLHLLVGATLVLGLRRTHAQSAPVA